MFTKTIKASLVAATISAATLGGIGISMAAQTPNDSSSSAASDQGQPGKQPEARKEEARTRLSEALAPRVQDGTISQAQSDAVVETLIEARIEHAKDKMGEKLQAAAEVLGTDVDTLMQELRSGKTLAELASEKGVSVDVLVDALVSDATAQLDQAVADGKLDQSKADEIKSKLSERVTARVNGEAGAPGRHHRGPGAAKGSPVGQ